MLIGCLAGEFDRAQMTILNLWQEARGHVLRERYERLKSRIDAADVAAKSACFGVVKSRFEFFRSRYAIASSADRKRILAHASKIARQLSERGDWPRASGLTIIMLNLQARDLPGDDAAAVTAAIDVLMEEANAYPEPDALKKAG
jgi:FMN phosphatase YigB (HAD superfamily)